MADSRPGDSYNVHIGGSVSGKVAIGSNITQVEVQQLTEQMEQLRRQVEAEAPADQKKAALQQVTAIQQEIQSGKPDVGKLEAAKRWFVANLPKLAGAVGSIVVSPIVGKLVQAAGDAMAQRLSKDVAGRP